MQVAEEIKKERGWFYEGKIKLYWKICEYCKREYKGIGKFYCSNKCSRLANPIKFWTGKNRSEEEKTKISLAQKGRKITDEQRLKNMSLCRIGKPLLKNRKENHWNWNPDRKAVLHNKRNDAVYGLWRRAVRERDGWICRLKNKDCNKLTIIHHIKSWAYYPDLRYKISNGIVLCTYHHPKKTRKRNYDGVKTTKLITSIEYIFWHSQPHKKWGGLLR